jgi:threonyl-tRNA synthetase
MPVITLPDGSLKTFDRAISVADVAASIGPGLAKAALAGRVDGVLVDTSALIDHDASLSIVTDKDPDGLDIIRHSTAHLLANAVQELYPEAQVTIGPVIEDGFYYDFAYKRPFSTEDWRQIESAWPRSPPRTCRCIARVVPRDEGGGALQEMARHYKAEIISAIPAGEVDPAWRAGRLGGFVPRAACAEHRQAQGRSSLMEGGRRLLARGFAQ